MVVAENVDMLILQEKQRKLYRSAEAGNVQIINTILTEIKSYAIDRAITRILNEPLDTSCNGELPFHAAARGGRVSALQAVMPTDLRVPTTSGLTALHVAAAKGHCEATEWLLDRCSDTESSSLSIVKTETGDGKKNTPLHLAVLLRYRDVAALLVQRGACLTCLNKDKMMPISYCQDQEMFTALMSSSADCDAISAADALNRTVGTEQIHAGAGFLDVVGNLCEVDATNRNLLHYAAIHCTDVGLLVNLIFLTCPDQLTLQAKSPATSQGTFLHEAARVGNMAVLEALKRVSHVIDRQKLDSLLCGRFKSKDGSAHTPALDALFNNRRHFFDEIVAMAGHTLSISLETVITKLLEDWKIRNDLAKKLNRRGSGTSAAASVCARRCLPLHHGVVGGDHSAPPQGIKDFAEELPTYLALYAGKIDLFDLMLDAGIMTINQWDHEYNRTCLHWAVLHRRADIVSLLVRSEKETWRPSPSIRDAYGKTAMQIAFEQNNQEIMAILRSSPAFKEQVEKLYRDREVYVQALNAILVGSALIGGVTFDGWLQLPSSVFESTAQKSFWASNSVSFFLAVAVMCVTIAALLPTPTKYVGAIVNQLRLAVVVVASFFVISLAAVTCAFAAAGFAALKDTDGRSGTESTPTPASAVYFSIMGGSTGAGVALCGIALAVFVVQLIKYGDVLPVLAKCRRRGERSREDYPQTSRECIKRADLVAEIRRAGRGATAVDPLIDRMKAHVQDVLLRTGRQIGDCT